MLHLKSVFPLLIFLLDMMRSRSILRFDSGFGGGYRDYKIEMNSARERRTLLEILMIEAIAGGFELKVVRFVDKKIYYLRQGE